MNRRIIYGACIATFAVSICVIIFAVVTAAIDRSLERCEYVGTAVVLDKLEPYSSTTRETAYDLVVKRDTGEIEEVMVSVEVYYSVEARYSVEYHTCTVLGLTSRPKIVLVGE
jgi:hypothetical protein